MEKISLIDYLAYKLKLDYVSDLNRLSAEQKGRLRYLLETKIEPDEVTESEWLDACQYISGKKCSSKEDARSCLLSFLSAGQIL